MGYKLDYSEEKNVILQSTRDISFQDIIEAIAKGNLLDDIEHFNKKKYPRQRIFIVKVRNQVYAVPYIIDKTEKRIFLKTIYPSRKLKRKFTK